MQLASRGLSIAGRGVQELSIRGFDEAHGIGTWRNLLVAVWRTETRESAVEGVSRVLGDLVIRQREVAILQVVEAGASPPEAGARRAISDMLARHSHSIRCSAVVFEGDGFRAATLRAVVTGITLLSRPPYPHVVFASTVAAINWTARHLSHDSPAWTEQARNAVAELRQVISSPTQPVSGPMSGVTNRQR